MRSRDEWIERYVREVGRRLPRRSRQDVEAELRSLLADGLDERLGEAGRPEDEEAEVLTYLRDFGAPETVAGRYAPSGLVLIGSRLYPAYLTTLAVVLGVYALLTILWMTGVPTSVTGLPLHLRFDPSTHLDDVILNAVANVGIVTVVFAAIQRFTAPGRRPVAEWDPARLPALETPRPETVSRATQAALAIGIVILALLFNYAPRWVGLLAIHDGEWGILPMLRPEYRVHLPYLNAFWAGALGLRLALLWTGRWTAPTRAAELALGVAGAWILWRILQGGPFTLLDVLVKPGLWIVFAITVLDQVGRAWRLLRRLARSRSGVPAEA